MTPCQINQDKIKILRGPVSSVSSDTVSKILPNPDCMYSPLRYLALIRNLVNVSDAAQRGRDKHHKTDGGQAAALLHRRLLPRRQGSRPRLRPTSPPLRMYQHRRARRARLQARVHHSKLCRDGEVPQMTTGPPVLKHGEPCIRYRSFLCLGRKSWTSSPLQVLNFRGLVWTAGTVLPVLPIPVPTVWGVRLLKIECWLNVS